jgi:mannose-6-phosphate isomerase-like protein (cupin superfamily)
MKTILFFLSAIFSLTLISQNNYSSLDTIKAPAVFENVYVRPLYKDSAEVSSYVIFIKTEVKMHKHLSHAEHVVVLAGNGEMTLGEKKFFVKKGDIIFIPKNTFHGVKTTSKFPLKVLSIQAPFFDGKDRVMMGN